MENSGAVTWASEADRKRDLRQQKIRALKQKIYMAWTAIYWRFLWATRLAKPYSRFMCRMGWYRKYMNGRCMYCGKFNSEKVGRGV